MYINTQSMSLKTYVRYKIKLLEKDFFVQMSKDERDHFEVLCNKTQVDNYTRDILNKYL